MMKRRMGGKEGRRETESRLEVLVLIVIASQALRNGRVSPEGKRLMEVETMGRAPSEALPPSREGAAA